MAGRILIVDDVATNRIVFKVKLGAACYHPLLAADGETALRLAREGQPDLVLLNMTLPDMPGIEVLRQLRAHPATRAIPVVMVTTGGSAEARLAALEAGAEDCLEKPIDDGLLLARLRNLLRTHEALAELGHQDGALHALGFAESPAEFDRPGRIALIADRTETALRWRKDLAGQLRDRICVLTADEALTEAPGNDAGLPDLFVIEGGGAGTHGGLRLMSDLRSRTRTRHAAIVVLQDQATPADLAMAYDMGASLALGQPVAGRELALRLQGLVRHKIRADRLRASVQDGLRLALIDPLTGLYNRRYAQPRLTAIAERARAEGRSFAVMAIDLDRFKSVNDRFGHAAGDAVLIEVARRLTDNLRPADLVARIGGEEFLVALPDAGMNSAQRTAERLCRAVEETPFRLADGRGLSLTVSIGLAVSSFEEQLPEDIAQVVDRADRALLTAKAGGRNQVISHHTAA